MTSRGKKIPKLLAFAITLLLFAPAPLFADPGEGPGFDFSLRAEGEARYDDNILSLSDRDKDLLNDNPSLQNSDRFRIETPDDFILVPDVAFLFSRSPRRGRETRIGVTLRAYDYLRNSVKDYQEYGVSLRQELNRSRAHRIALTAAASRIPRYYLRQLIDDDESLAAGTTIRNSADYALNRSHLDLSLEVVNRTLTLAAGLAQERRNYNDHFNERDSNSLVSSLEIEVYPLRRIGFRIRPYYDHENRTSRGDLSLSAAVVDDDVGFDSDLYGLDLRGLWGPDSHRRHILTAWYETEKRAFTSKVSTDLGHFDREDDITQFGLGYDKELEESWRVHLFYRHRNNDSSTLSSAGGRETTSFEKDVVGASVVYSFNPRTRRLQEPKEP